MQKTTILVAVLLSLSLGYFIRAYTEKPKTIEIPKDRVITKTQYVDRVTKQLVTVETEVVKYDTAAAVKIATKSPSLMLGVTVGSSLDNLGAPVYGAYLQKKVLGNFYLGVGGALDGSGYLSIGYSF